MSGSNQTFVAQRIPNINIENSFALESRIIKNEILNIFCSNVHFTKSKNYKFLLRFLIYNLCKLTILKRHNATL